MNNRTYAFIALETASTIVIYDITDPAHPEFSGIHIASNESEDYKASGAKQADHMNAGLCPETMAFIPAKLSPTGKPLLAVAYEVSGTTSLYEIGFKNKYTSAQVP